MLKEEMYSVQFEKTLFNSISRSYDIINNYTLLNLPVSIRKRIIQSLNEKEGKVEILDLMSGLGENWNALREKYPNANITAIDISESMTNLSQKYLLDFGYKNVKVINDNIFKVALPSNNFDLVLCSFGLKCLSPIQYESFVMLLKGILKKDGTYLLMEVTKPKNAIACFIQYVGFRYLLPCIGGLCFNKFRQYQMLWKYLDNFSAKEFVSVFEKHRVSIHCQKYLWGNITAFTN